MVWSKLFFPRGRFWRTQFNVFSSLDVGIECILDKPAADPKSGGSIDLFKGRKVLQWDLDRLNQWAEVSCMRFKKAKGWILYLGHKNPVQ